MNSAQRNLLNEWSFNIVAQKEVDFPNVWCSDLQYITSANEWSPNIALAQKVINFPKRSKDMKNLLHLRVPVCLDLISPA